ncbi:hypothetical protein FW778_17655 [Ginsengibacter hankyongi]|uniref:Uncharacterized protein n=1 Tax=Ginsengibacter hankyongi TaxID=2607284 RepID=A0A5J5IEP5_9BACT|nr:hypothetical protein [Ginsengibacter hankyongi]KAA9037253.1 hypothetical protein FW778_17655 [Ginsengibacter hankyongi]
MGYEVHIIRRDDYENDEEDSSITMDEWLEYISNDPELNLTNGYKLDIPNVETSWEENPGFCLWTGHSEGVPSESLWFDFWKGTISAKYPDDETIKKMLSIAKALNARVQGDDNEFYDDSYFKNKKNSESNETSESRQIQADKKPWCKFW